MYEVFDRSPEELIILEEHRKSLKASREASIETSRETSIHAIKQANKQQTSIPESETEAGDDVAIEEGIEGKHKTELWLNSLSTEG